MKDIFEILKHENHDIQIVKYENEYILGCKTCGETLITESEIKKCSEEYIEILNVVRERSRISNLYTKLMKIGKKILEFTQENYVAKIIANLIVESMKNRDDVERYEDYDRVAMSFNLRKRINNVYKDKLKINEPFELIEAIYEDNTLDSYKEKMLLIIEELNKITDKYSVLMNDEEIVISSNIFKIDNYVGREYYILVINNQIKEEMEKEHPTPTDVYTFKDMNDFYDKQPTWEDEEQENFKLNEYLYRIKNDLYDFDNLNLLDILKSVLEDYRNYDYVKSNIATMDMILETYGISLK